MAFVGNVPVSAGKKKCRFHPNVAARVFCNKLEYGYCASCLESCVACTDPELYCRHRDYCIIWELCRNAVRKRKTPADCQPEP
jgi:hypothetical protein